MTPEDAKQEIKDRRTIIQLEEARIRSMQQALEVQEQLRDDDTLSFIQRDEAIRQIGILTQNLQNQIETIDDLRDKQDELTKALDKYNDKLAAGETAYKNMAGSILELSPAMGKFKGALEGGRVGLKGFTEGLLTGLKGGQLFLDVGFKMIDMTVQFALEQNKVTAEFRSNTGAGNEFNNVIRDTERAVFATGITMGKVSEAVGVLKNEFTDYTYMSQEQMNATAKTTVLLDQMGFSLSTQASIMQTATQAMGMSAQEGEALLIDLASTARSLGVDVNTLGAAFEANKDFIVRFGEDGQEVFEELAVTAKALGIDLGVLVKITEGFETFDGAAQSVGRLNAILGGPFLNSMDMLNASYEDPIEGIKMLREAFDQAGVSAEDLSGAELKAYASALNLSTSETIKLLGASNEELEIKRLKEEELAEQALAAVGITDKLKAAFTALYINLGPLVDQFIVPAVDGFSEMAQGIGDMLNTTGGLTAFGAILAGVLGAGIGLMLGFTAAIPVVGPALALAASGISLSYIAAWTAGAALVGGILGAGAGAMMPDDKKSPTEPRFAKGGVVQGTSTAIVGEQGPEMVEMPVGTRVTTAPKTEQLTNAITKLISKLDNAGGGSQNISVYIGREKIDEIVIKALNSPAGSAALSPFGNG
jgi:hypothetical protein